MLTPVEMIQTYIDGGRAKCARALPKTFVLAIWAGLCIAFASAGALTASHAMEDAGLARLVSGIIFPFGLGLVVLTGAELFTGNMLLCTSLHSRQITPFQMLRSWGVSYLGNFIGALALAAGCAFFGQLNLSGGGLAVQAIRVAITKSSLGFPSALVLGIFCNILVCAAVLCGMTAKTTSGRIMGVFLPIALFIICGFEHSIANIYYGPVGIFAAGIPEYAALAREAGLDPSTLSWGTFLLGNLLPVTLGNMIGGTALGMALSFGLRARPSGGADS